MWTSITEVRGQDSESFGLDGHERHAGSENRKKIKVHHEAEHSIRSDRLARSWTGRPTHGRVADYPSCFACENAANFEGCTRAVIYRGNKSWKRKINQEHYGTRIGKGDIYP